MEVAAYLAEKAHSVSVVELEETPFRRFLGERVGRALMKVSPRVWGGNPSSRSHGSCSLPACPRLWQMFENNHVKFYMQTELSELRAHEGKVGLAPYFPLLPQGGAPAHHPSPLS